MSTYSYSEYADGPDPLQPPFDGRNAADAIGEAVLGGVTPVEALQDLLARFLLNRAAQRSLDDLLRQLHERQQELRGLGRLDGIIERVRALLDTAVGQERELLSAAPQGDATPFQATIEAAPADTAPAMRYLAGYDWRSPQARQTFELLKTSLVSEGLEARFRGLGRAAKSPDPLAIRRIKDMLGELNELLAADAYGEDTRPQFAEFTRRYVELDISPPPQLEELADSLLNQMLALNFLLQTLKIHERREIVELMSDAFENADLAAEMAKLTEILNARRAASDLTDTVTGVRISGTEPLALSDATVAVEELIDLIALERGLTRGSRDDIRESAALSLLDQHAASSIEALGRMSGELERQGYLRRENGDLVLTPRTVQRLGDNSLHRIFAGINRGRRPGGHDQPNVGRASELTGDSRPWEFGDEQPLDISATLRNAVIRTGQLPIRIFPQDFEVVQTERRTSAAVSLLLDQSYSMALRGFWAPAKQTALALLSLLRSKFPQDVVQIVGFSNYARQVTETELAAQGWDMIQGTNLHHALMQAVRHIDRHPHYEPVVLLVTDGEPTAHLMPDGRSWFDWPPAPETIELTMAEVDKLTRRHAEISIFLLADDSRLIDFANSVAKRNGGRVFHVDQEHLGEYVIQEFLRTRAAKKR